jgi:DNA-binding response OmpR family regulator
MSRIILVDDDEIIAELVSEVLISAGHAVGWLSDGATALDLICRWPPHLVILDCNMPDMSGVDVLRTMRRSLQMCQVPVLMLTGRKSQGDERIVSYEGANDYFRKPFDPVTLVGRAEALMAGGRLLF